MVAFDQFEIPKTYNKVASLANLIQSPSESLEDEDSIENVEQLNQFNGIPDSGADFEEE